jgi:hypothetical protein
MGYITGTDDVHVDNCKFIDNGESGIKTGQYVQRWWTTPNRCCSSVDITNCYAAGQYYDGFDLQMHLVAVKNSIKTLL